MGVEAENRNVPEVAQECVCMEGLSSCAAENTFVPESYSRRFLAGSKGMFKYEQIFRLFHVNLTSGFLKADGAGLCKAQEAH